MIKMEFSTLLFTLTIFLLFSRKDEAYGYEVEIVLNPETGPYLIGNSIDCYCFVVPTPPSLVTYQWNIPGVLSNSTIVAQGKRLIEVYGLIYPANNLVHTFMTGETISLQVNISSTMYQARYIQNLTWYHNGSQVCACRTRNNGTELLMPNAQSNEAGVYQVKIGSLSFRRPDCDSMLLPQLESFASMAPVTFVLTQDSYVYDFEDFIPVKQHFITAYNNNNMTFVFKNEYCFHRNITRWLSQYHRESGFHNGSMLRLNANDVKYNSSFHAKQNGEAVFTLKVTNLSAANLGEYIGVISASFYDVLSSCDDHRQFLPFWWYVFRNTIPIAVTYYTVDIYRSPVITLTSSVASAAGNYIEVVCSATDGNPNVHQITLTRDAIAMKVVDKGDSLVYRAIDEYGLFTCAVKSLHSTARKFLLLQEKVNFQLLAVLADTPCNQFLDMTEQHIISKSIHEKFQHVCHCTAVSEINFISCHSMQLLKLNGSITYSDGRGEITASTVLHMIQEWTLDTEDISIDIEGNTVELSRVCLTRINTSDSNITCKLPSCVKSNPRVQVGVAIGGSFIGGLVTGVCMCALVACICFCSLKMKAVKEKTKHHSSTNSKEDEVEMGTNEAYESVSLRYTATSGSQLHQRNTRDEVIYELPAT